MSAVAEAPAAVNGIARFARPALKLALFLGAVETAIRALNQRYLLARPSGDRQHGEGGVPRGRARPGKANAVPDVIPAPALDASEAWRKHGILRIVREQCDGVENAVDRRQALEVARLLLEADAGETERERTSPQRAQERQPRDPTLE